MKEILKEYIFVLRDEEALKKKELVLRKKKRDLVKQLLHSKLPNGSDIYDIVLKDRTAVKRSLQANMPDDANDVEIFEVISLRNELLRAKRAEDNIVEDYEYGLALKGNITDGSHEGW